ncbi:protein TRANSPARENT TESTA 9 isoform X3 [Arachis hypogaea]|uniref:protein TRANSPARENT TESTA 9 isoform X3 n=1 Tax=Arachis hypogaea TaxID=3818 RepID=UPI003B21D11C
MRSRELVLDLLQSVVEIITYGDKHDPSILETVSGKINRDTLCLLVNVHGDVVVSFPLYTEALRFSHHEEKMIQTAVRTIALNIYNGIWTLKKEEID